MNGETPAPLDRSGTNSANLRDLLTRREQENASTRRELKHVQRVGLAGQLALGTLHDFNNALTCVISLNQLGEGAAGDEAARYRAGIENAALRAARLARQLLRIGRKSDAEPEDIDVDAQLQEFQSNLNRLFERRITCCCEAGSGAGVRMDPVQFDQIVFNLAKNARDAMNDGGTLTLASRMVDDPTPLVEISISDSGSGIEPELLDRVFEPFFTSKPNDSGTGLGLAMVRRIVEEHRGRIDVQSEIGTGTTVRISLPRIELQNREEATEEPERPPHGTARVLIVEPDAHARGAMADLLRRLGYTTAEAADRDTAIALQPNVDLVLVRSPDAELLAALSRVNANVMARTFETPVDPRVLARTVHEATKH